MISIDHYAEMTSYFERRKKILIVPFFLFITLVSYWYFLTVVILLNCNYARLKECCNRLEKWFSSAVQLTKDKKFKRQIISRASQLTEYESNRIANHTLQFTRTQQVIKKPSSLRFLQVWDCPQAEKYGCSLAISTY